MTVPTTSTEQAQRDAKAERDRLHQAVMAGDTTISGADLAEADSAVRIADLRHEAAQQLAAEEAERIRLARIAEFEQLIAERFGEHEGGVIAAFDDAVKALAPLVAAVQEHNSGLSEVVEELLALKPLPPSLDPSRGSQGLHLPKDDVRIVPLDVATLLAEVSWRALDAAGDASASKIEPLAQIRRDRHANEYQGIADGDLSSPPKASGPSDRLRRTARIVAKRTT